VVSLAIIMKVYHLDEKIYNANWFNDVLIKIKGKLE